MRIKSENEVLMMRKMSTIVLKSRLGFLWVTDSHSCELLVLNRSGCSLNCEHEWPEIAINFNLMSNFIPAVYIFN